MEKKYKLPFFSIVMPVYNAEKYIREAINSICAQTFTDWECLIINDCSSDNTLKILEEYKKKDSRIQIFSLEENQGVSSARNKGIRCAKGKYLWFVDADDRVELNMLENLHEKLVKTPAKLTVFGLYEEYYDEEGKLEYTNPRSPQNGYYNSKEEARKQFLKLEQNTLYGYPWNKVYQTDYLQDMKLEFEDYRKTKFIEDILFNIQYSKEIDSLLLIDIKPYHYAKRSNSSLTNEYVPEYYEFHRRRIKELWNQQKYWKQDMKESKEILGALYARYILSAITRNYDKKAEMSFLDKYKFCKRIFKDELFMELVPYGKATDSLSLKIALKILNTKNVILNLCFSWMIYIIQTKLPVVYSKVKAQR